MRCILRSESQNARSGPGRSQAAWHPAANDFESGWPAWRAPTIRQEKSSPFTEDADGTMADMAIRYDELVQDALRGVVRTVLERVARDGLPGDHHFFIAFRSGAPGVVIPTHLRDRYPDEMTIVLQHRFWDLEVEEEQFSVGLSFGGRAETLVIPFRAITGFVDPSVQFALQFAEASGKTMPTAPKETRPPADAPPERSSGPQKEEPGGAEVVALDRFRKKT